MDQLAAFIKEASGHRRGARTWLEDDVMHVYVRKGFHLIEGKMRTCLDIASVEVVEAHRGKGIFRDFLRKAHALNPWEYTFVESVLNDILAAFLAREGFTEDGEEDFYLKKV